MRPKEQVRKGLSLGRHLLQSAVRVLFLPGPQLTHVAVLQYGGITTIDVPWNVAQEKTHLLSLVDYMQQEGGPSQIGNGVLRAGMQGLCLVPVLGICDKWPRPVFALGLTFLSCKVRA